MFVTPFPDSLVNGLRRVFTLFISSFSHVKDHSEWVCLLSTFSFFTHWKRNGLPRVSPQDGTKSAGGFLHLPCLSDVRLAPRGSLEECRNESKDTLGMGM